MPYSPAQIRYFGHLNAIGKLSDAEFAKMRHEGIRKDVDKSGHATTKSARSYRRQPHSKRARAARIRKQIERKEARK